MVNPRGWRTTQVSSLNVPGLKASLCKSLRCMAPNKHPYLTNPVSMDYAKEYPVAMKAITEWIEKGLLKRKFHIVNGLDGAPGALPLLYSGGNTGKLWVLLLVPVDPVSHFASPESSGFPNTKPHPSYKPRNCPMLQFISRYLRVVLVHGHGFAMVFECYGSDSNPVS